MVTFTDLGVYFKKPKARKSKIKDQVGDIHIFELYRMSNLKPATD